MYGIYYHTRAWDPKCNPYLMHKGSSYDRDLDDAIKEANLISTPSPIPEGFINRDENGYNVGRRYPHFLLATPFKDDEVSKIINDFSIKYNLSEENIKNFQVFDIGKQYQLEVDDNYLIRLIYNHPMWGMKLDLIPKSQNIIGTYFPIELDENKIISSLYKQNEDFRDIVDNNGKVIKNIYS